ncbi:MAG TPA: hypothetical protein VIG33_00130, partial [Pseudobdellovibrionaceae bacterium]
MPFAPGENSTSFDIHGLGFGKLKSVFFSSAPALPEAEGESANLVRTWQPALPFQACIKPNRLFCFAGEATPITVNSGKKSQAEIDICGDANVKAYFEISRLKSIQNLVSGVALPQKIAEQAARDKEYIENLVSKYEKEKGVKVNLNWLDKKTSLRCEIFKNTEENLPDTQAGIFESEEAITIAVRGTEPGNERDIRTNVMTFNQVDLSASSSGTGSVHRGFYKA